MSCGTACLDCPSCTGSVPHDAPAMRDLDFAMAMQSNEIRQDRFLGPYGVVQTVRDAVQRRGASSTGDAQIMRFLEHTTMHADGIPVRIPAGMLFDATPKWDPKTLGPGPFPWQGRQPPDIMGPDEGDINFPTSPSESEEIFNLGGWCCVENFWFRVQKTMEPKSTDKGPKGKQATRGGKKAAVISFEWGAYAVFSDNKDVGCVCKCCQYRQYVLWNRLQMNGVEVGAPDGLREDCMFIEVEREDDGTPRPPGPNGKVPTKQSRALPGYTPEGKKGVDWWGPYCSGHRKPQGDNDPFPKLGQYPWTNGCNLKIEDEPTAPVLCGAEFTWQIGFLGIIHDTCFFWVPRRWRTFSVEIKGKVGADCKTEFTEITSSSPGKHPDKKKK